MTKRPFVIYSTQRSGSTLLNELLDQHPQVICAGEIFKARDSLKIFHPDCSFRYDERQSSLAFKLWPNVMLKRFVSKIASKRAEVFGCKLMVSQIDKLPHLPKILDEQGWYKIVLQRRSKVKQILSLEISRALSTWVNKGSEESNAVHLDIDHLRSTARYLMRSASILDNLEQEADLVLTYEDLVADLPQAMQSIFRSLGLDSDFKIDPPAHRPSSKQSYAERILNFDEVKATLLAEGLDEQVL